MARKYKDYPEGWIEHLRKKKKLQGTGSSTKTKKKKRSSTSLSGRKIVRSKGEMEVYLALKKFGVSFIEQFSFDDCINPKTNHLLYFDFFIPSLLTCIEFDGIQHFQYVKEFDKGDYSQLNKRKYRDRLKTSYCIANNIRLIRIRFNKIGAVEAILKDKLNL